MPLPDRSNPCPEDRSNARSSLCPRRTRHNERLVCPRCARGCPPCGRHRCHHSGPDWKPVGGSNQGHRLEASRAVIIEDARMAGRSSPAAQSSARAQGVQPSSLHDRLRLPAHRARMAFHRLARCSPPRPLFTASRVVHRLECCSPPRRSFIVPIRIPLRSFRDFVSLRAAVRGSSPRKTAEPAAHVALLRAVSLTAT
jgi:hypothetical protein